MNSIQLLKPAAVSNGKVHEVGLGKRIGRTEPRSVLGAHAVTWDRIKRMDGQVSCDRPRGRYLSKKFNDGDKR
jgi:hypothetical protein